MCLSPMLKTLYFVPHALSPLGLVLLAFLDLVLLAFLDLVLLAFWDLVLLAFLDLVLLAYFVPHARSWSLDLVRTLAFVLGSRTSCVTWIFLFVLGSRPHALFRFLVHCFSFSAPRFFLRSFFPMTTSTCRQRLAAIVTAQIPFLLCSRHRHRRISRK